MFSEWFVVIIAVLVVIGILLDIAGMPIGG